ncbi:MAG: MDR family MFS transporter [Chloroflexota bacterium]
MAGRHPAAGHAASSEGGRRIHGIALVSVLGALMLTLLLEALDQTVVGTSLPKIIAVLHGFDRYTWVVTAYLLGSTTMVPIVGKLSDQFGRKWFFVVGVVVFLVGSILSGASQTINQLIAFRALQGLGAGTGIALVVTVVGDIFPPAERARWQGLFASVYGFASVIGPTLGGWLTDHGPLVGHLVTDATRWRWVFYVNVPLGILALLALLTYLPADISIRGGRASLRHVDFPGALLASAATISVLLGLTWGANQTYDWGSVQVIAALGAAAVLYAGFFVVERFANEPILPLDLFQNTVFTPAAILALATGAVLLSLAIYLPLFLQGVMGESATSSGEVITPLTISVTAGALLAGLVVARRQRYRAVTIVGGAILVAGVALLSRMTPSTGLPFAAAAMVVAGLGLGSYFPVLTLAVQNALPRGRLGVVTGAITYLRALGQTIGVAIVGSVVNGTIAGDIGRRLPAGVTTQISPQALKYATDPRVLVDPTSRQAVVRIAQGLAEHVAVQKAVAAVPAGPQHAQAVASVTGMVTAQTGQRVQALLDQVFAALKDSLAVGVQHGLLVVLLFAVIILATSFFLKDVPLSKSFNDESGPSDGQLRAGPRSEPLHAAPAAAGEVR